MKNLLITLIGVVSIRATPPAFAGPDFQLIEQGRKAKAARMQQAAATQAQLQAARACLNLQTRTPSTTK